jgi:hypothetical protein
MHTQVAEAKVDTLVMKHFLSGFSDADAKLILKHCKEVLPRHANILLLQVRHIRFTPVKEERLTALIARLAVPYSLVQNHVRSNTEGGRKLLRWRQLCQRKLC